MSSEGSCKDTVDAIIVLTIRIKDMWPKSELNIACLCILDTGICSSCGSFDTILTVVSTASVGLEWDL